MLYILYSVIDCVNSFDMLQLYAMTFPYIACSYTYLYIPNVYSFMYVFSQIYV